PVQRGDRLHRRAYPYRLAVGDTALQAAGAVGDPPDPVRSGDDLIMGLRAPGPGLGERVADLDALDRLDRHQGGGEPGVERAVPLTAPARAGRPPVREALDDPAERVGVPLGRVDLLDHPAARVRVEAAQRVGVDAFGVLGPGHEPGFRGHAAQLDDVGDDLDAERLAQEGPRDGTEGDPGGGLPGARPLEDRPRVDVAELLHAGQVGVARPGAGERGVAREAGGHVGVARVRGHHALPLRPLGVADPDGHRAALGHTVPDTADDLDLVLLEAHPGTAAVAEAAAAKLLCDLGARHGDPGGHAVQDRD